MAYVALNATNYLAIPPEGHFLKKSLSLALGDLSPVLLD